jgi:hypothetical protein
LEELQQHFDENAGQYPLLDRGKEAKQEVSAFFAFFTHLIYSDDDGIWDGILLEVLSNWIVAMTSSSFRPFRHTATSLALHICSCLCPVISNLDHPNQNTGRESHAQLYNSVFVHRYRDIDPVIRRECLLALANWMHEAPTEFLDPSHLRYFGWMLNDREPTVRLTVVNALDSIFGDSRLSSGLRLFSERFKQRILDMAVKEIDSSVQLAAVRVISHIYDMGILSESEVYQFVSISLTAYSPIILKVMKEETCDMSWETFGNWIIKLVKQVYNIAVPASIKSSSGNDHLSYIMSVTHDAKNAENAISFLVQNYDLDIFSQYQSLTSIIKGQDSSSCEETLLQIAAALTQKSTHVAQHFATIVQQLQVKFKGNDIATLSIVDIIRNIGEQWIQSTTSTLSFSKVLSELRESFFRAQSRWLIRAIIESFAYLVDIMELQPNVQPHIEILIDECDASRFPLHAAELFRRFAPKDYQVSNLSSSPSHLEVRLLISLWKKCPDPNFEKICMDILREDRTQVIVCNLYCEFLAAFNRPISDQGSAIIESVLFEKLTSIVFEIDSGSTTQHEICVNPSQSTESLACGHLIAEYVKLLNSLILPFDYAPSLLRFYRSFSGQPFPNVDVQILSDTVDEGAKFIVDHLCPKMSQAILSEIVLISLQKSLSVRHGRGIMSLALLFSSMYKKLKSATALPVFDDAMQWIFDSFEPPMGDSPGTLGATLEEESDKIGPFLRALCSMASCLTITDTKYLHAKYQKSTLLEPLLAVLAKKSGIKISKKSSKKDLPLKTTISTPSSRPGQCSSSRHQDEQFSPLRRSQRSNMPRAVGRPLKRTAHEIESDEEENSDENEDSSSSFELGQPKSQLKTLVSMQGDSPGSNSNVTLTSHTPSSRRSLRLNAIVLSKDTTEDTRPPSPVKKRRRNY